MIERSQSQRHEVIIAPSLLSANFLRLEESLGQAAEGGAQWLHFDVMDGNFVPNISIGPLVLKAIRPATKLFIDCHLMIEHPDKYIPEFVKAGANSITVHLEACRHLNRTVQLIHSLGVKAGVAINPATPIALLQEILPEVDVVLLMSVNPGFGGQEFIPSLFRKATTLREWISRERYNCLIEADGGIKLDNIAEVYKAGVDVVVSGSGIFGASDPAHVIREMKSVCDRAVEVQV